MIIYADILIGVNILINYFLLLFTGHICRNGYKTMRLVLGAALGGIFSLYIFLPKQIFIVEFLIKAVICCFIIFISFGFVNFKIFLRTVICFLAATLLFAGAVLAIYFIFKPAGVVINNGVIYFNISPLLLIAGTAVCYLILTLIERFTVKDYKNGKTVTAKIFYKNRQTDALCLIDTGNSVKDLISNRPVIILNQTKCKTILGKTLTEDIIKNNTENDIKGFRLIPFSTVSESGLLLAFKADKVELNGRMLHNCIIAQSKQNFSKDYDGIVNPQILKI